MKDYSLTKEEAKMFILKYEIKEKDIIVYFANGTTTQIPYTKNNEMKLLDKMNAQLEASEEFLKQNKFSYSTNLGTVSMSLLAIIIILICSLLNISLGIIAPIGLILGSITFTGSFKALINRKNNIKDVKKHKYFKSHELQLNQIHYFLHYQKNNKNILYNTKESTKKLIKSTKKDRVVFTINSIDSIPFEDLTQIMDNIQREKTFNFDYPNEQKNIELKKLP